ncbi:MAG TPA: PDZ domain-containing protein, partial [Acidimicrobiales bacterium]|nr:PDZ domain-containing protein [Acidimicrobiales bacterium]
TGLFDGSPAGAAGIEAGDEIRAVDGRPVATVAELQASLYTAAPGTTVELTTVRGSNVRQLSVTLASEPA